MTSSHYISSQKYFNGIWKKKIQVKVKLEDHDAYIFINIFRMQACNFDDN